MTTTSSPTKLKFWASLNTKGRAVIVAVVAVVALGAFALANHALARPSIVVPKAKTTAVVVEGYVSPEVQHVRDALGQYLPKASPEELDAVAKIACAWLGDHNGSIEELSHSIDPEYERTHPGFTYNLNDIIHIAQPVYCPNIQAH